MLLAAPPAVRPMPDKMMKVVFVNCLFLGACATARLQRVSALGNVDRIIFCSVPIRGSRIACSWIGKLGSALIAPSSQFEEFFSTLEKKNPAFSSHIICHWVREKLLEW